jgi:hypothetical protein
MMYKIRTRDGKSQVSIEEVENLKSAVIEVASICFQDPTIELLTSTITIVIGTRS